MKSFLEYAAEKLHVRQVGDWTRVPLADLAKIGGSGLLRVVGLRNALEIAYGAETVAKECGTWESGGTKKRQCYLWSFRQ